MGKTTIEKIKRKANELIVYFKYAEGLKTLDGKQPDFFTIADSDGKFVTANAVISGNRVFLSSPDVMRPAIARFAWTESARPNLVNAAGLPAVPFRTDPLTWKYKNELK